jgi:diguanylate cyclase (GGDEF)-like protein
MSLSNSVENIRKLYHLNKAMDELNRLYVIDPLCGIYNRNGFMNISEDMLRECAAHKNKILLGFIDMDGLKFINDNYGHNEGDFAIQHLSRVIKQCCGANYICARFGGDEFVIFGTDIQESDADELARHFEALLQSANSTLNKPYTISASLGSVVTVAQNTDTIYNLVEQADNKMYESKKHKKMSRRYEPV